MIFFPSKKFEVGLRASHPIQMSSRLVIRKPQHDPISNRPWDLAPSTSPDMEAVALYPGDVTVTWGGVTSRLSQGHRAF